MWDDWEGNEIEGKEGERGENEGFLPFPSLYFVTRKQGIMNDMPTNRLQRSSNEEDKQPFELKTYMTNR